MHPDPIHDPRCLVTSESLFVDGANGVCRDPRVGDPGPWRALGLLVAAALACALWSRRLSIPRRRRTLVIVAFAIGAALPGWAALLAIRADRPTHAAASAHDAARLHDAMRRFAIEHECATVRVDHCLTCAPVWRLALAGLRCDHPASIELHEDAWQSRCTTRGETLVCGSPR